MADDLYTIDLDAIKARLEAATAGPWKRSERMWDEHPIRIIVAPDGDGGEAEVAMEPAYFYNYPSHSWVETAGTDANAELIAHAPEDLAALVAEVERLESRQCYAVCEGLDSADRRPFGYAHSEGLAREIATRFCELAATYRPIPREECGDCNPHLRERRHGPL